MRPGEFFPLSIFIQITLFFEAHRDFRLQAFFWTFAQKLKVKKLKLKLKKLKTQEFFAQNSKFRQIYQKFKKFFKQI